MNNLKSALLAVLAALTASAALAAPKDPNVATVVSADPPEVTLSRNQLVTYASYRIDVTNNTTNSLNRVKVTGETTLLNTATTSIAIDSFYEVSGQAANCTVGVPSLSSLICEIGTIAPGAAPVSIVVVVQVPTAGTKINFSWNMVGYEGNSLTGQGCCGQSGVAVATLVEQTSPDAAKRARTFVKPGGGALFTGAAVPGSGAVTTLNDKFTTFVAIPPGSVFTTADIVENDLTNCNGFKTCKEVVLTIPATSENCPVAYSPSKCFEPYLTIVLRQDASNIKPGTKIESVLIDYVDDDNVRHPYIGDCETGPQPRTDGIPCIAARKYYKNDKVPGWIPALDGDFEWTIINLKNGRLQTGT